MMTLFKFLCWEAVKTIACTGDYLEPQAGRDLGAPLPVENISTTNQHRCGRMVHWVPVQLTKINQTNKKKNNYWLWLIIIDRYFDTNRAETQRSNLVASHCSHGNATIELWRRLFALLQSKLGNLTLDGNVKQLNSPLLKQLNQNEWRSRSR